MHASGDRELLEALRRNGPMTIHQLVAASDVTATTIRHRLNRLMSNGLVDRAKEAEGRGRPSHRYSLTDKARNQLGQNYAELAMTLWSELKSLEDSAVALEVLRGVAGRLAAQYRRQIPAGSIGERLTDLRGLLAERGVDAEVDESGALPVLRQHSCPYYELAERDRTVCGIEMRAFEQALNEDVKLSQCRLDGHQCCEFEVRLAPATHTVGLLPS